MSPPIRLEPGPSPGTLLAAIGLLGVAVGWTGGGPTVAALGVALLVPAVVVALRLRAAIAGALVVRDAPKCASEGDRVAIGIAITNSSRTPLCDPRIEEVFGPESLTPAVFAFPVRIDRGRTAEAARFAICRRARGIYPHGPMYLLASDPFGWFTMRRCIDLIEEFNVYPRLGPAQIPERLFSSLCEPEWARQARRFSDSDEFFSVRDYQPGDPLKRIHWALFARRDYPVVREFLPTVQPELAIYLDVSRRLRFSGTRLTNFESSVRLTASLAARAVRAGFRVQLRCGSEGAFDVGPALGHPQLRRVLETLIRVRTRTDDEFPATLLRRAERLQPGTTAVVTLHPYLLGDPGFAGAVAGLRRRGCRVVCIAYEVRPEALEAGVKRRHATYLARLAALGVELWNDKGAPLRPRSRAARRGHP